ncbi:major facilitator superfamily domain-containing protein, partial [Ochromonadaceae sp. CCMP2298]
MIRLTSNGRGKSSIPAVKSGLMMSIIADAQADIDVRAHAQRPGGPITPKDAQPMKSRYARVLLAGSGFLADAYDLFVINLVLRLLREEYPQYAASSSIRALEGSVAASALVGSIIGQLVAGSLADIIGRKKIFVTTALLITIGSFGSACSTDSQFLTIYGQLACWRFLLGAGVGGEYPLAATVTSESSSAARRGSLMAAVFSMQGVGALLSVLVVITCLTMGASNAFTWRFALAFGATPVLLAFPWRIKMHETETFKRVKRERSEAKKLSTDSLQGAMHDTGYGYGAGAETGYGTEAGYGTGAEANWAGDGVT